MRMRFRTDSARIAELKGLARSFDEDIEHRAWPTREEWDATPPAEPGDTWRIRWMVTIEQKDQGLSEGSICGYAICCPKCRQVHRWTSALDCIDRGCPHKGTASCWAWSGSAEDGTLSASPSLHCVTEWKGNPTGGCGWHGFLTNGELTGA